MFINKILLEIDPFVYKLSMAASLIQLQSWVVLTETIWPAMCTLFAIWPFKKKFVDFHFTVCALSNVHPAMKRDICKSDASKRLIPRMSWGECLDFLCGGLEGMWKGPRRRVQGRFTPSSGLHVHSQMSDFKTVLIALILFLEMSKPVSMSQTQRESTECNYIFGGLFD